MSGWTGSVTSYRLRCEASECGAETMVRERDLESTEWAVGSLHFHEGRCPEHQADAIANAADGAVAVADGGQAGLGAFSGGGAEPDE